MRQHQESTSAEHPSKKTCPKTPVGKPGQSKRGREISDQSRVGEDEVLGVCTKIARKGVVLPSKFNAWLQKTKKVRRREKFPSAGGEDPKTGNRGNP